jgi:hypothetical protein
MKKEKKNVLHSKLRYYLLGVRIDDISVELKGNICQRLVLYKISLPMTCIDIEGLFICTNQNK